MSDEDAPAPIVQQADERLRQEPPTAGDELSLYDLWNVLVRRRRVFAVITLLILSAGSGYAVLIPTIYEYRSGIDIGYVYLGERFESERHRRVEPSEGAQARLVDVIIPAVRREFGQDDGPVPRVFVSAYGASDGLLLSSRGEPVDQARIAAVHAAITERLAQYHLPRFQRELALVLQQIEVQIAVLERAIAADREQIESIQGRAYPETGEAGVVALLDAQRLAELRRTQAEWQAEKALLQVQIENVRDVSRGTELSFLASQSEQPVGSSRRLIIALTAVFGVMAGVFSAFLREFIHNARQRRAE